MATSLKNLTRVGADVRQLAALLQSKGRGRDTILAHITPQEAALLKARGGRGSTNPETGLPEFEDDVGPIEAYQTDPMYGGGAEMDTSGFAAPTEKPEVVSAPTPEPAVAAAPTPVATEVAPLPSFRPSQEYGPGMTGAETSAYDLATQAQAPVAGAPAPAAAPTPPKQDDFMQKLGLAGVQTLGTGLLARRAGKEQQAAAQQIGQLGAPYRAKGSELMGLAQQGQLTAAGQQQVEALRARAAQAQAGRGGVGATQTAQQIEQFRQQLLQQQYDLGLKLSGVSDQYALQAIRAGMSADQAVNQLLGSAMQNIGAIFAGQPAPQTPR